MIKIKLNLFELIVGLLFIPNIGIIFITILLIISLIIKQKPIVYKVIIISYIILFIIITLSLLICMLVSKKSKNEFRLFEDRMEYNGREYLIEEVQYCEYYVCKWYMVPFAFAYNEQLAGLIVVKFKKGEQLQFKTFYKNYLKIKNKIENIVEK